MSLILGLTVAYLLGSIPFGLVLVRLLAGVDIRKIGSGNVGATNASRAFGRARLPVFLLIYVLDFAKGFVPAFCFAGWAGLDGNLYPVLFGAAAILGHCTSPFLGFRGGKGVATSTGVLCVLSWPVLVAALAAFFVVLWLTKEVFLGSLTIGIVLAIGVVVQDPAAAFGERLPLTVFCAVLAVFLFYTHRSNIQKKFMRSRPA